MPTMTNRGLPLMICLTVCRVLQSHGAPVIDMQQWSIGGSLARGRIAQQVAEAYEKHGFFYVRNHGLEAKVIGDADEASRQFFDLPSKDKFNIEADKSRALKTARGYAKVRGEQLDISGAPDLKEVLDVGLPLGHGTATYLGPNPWPQAMPELQNATDLYLRAVFSVGMELLAAMALSLKLPEDAFADIFDEPLVIQRLMRYPAKASIEGAGPADLGCGAHYDFGGLTLLRQVDAPGLQVMPPAQSRSSGECEESGRPEGTVEIGQVAYSTVQGTFFADLRNRHVDSWVPVEFDPELLVVTFGEALQRLTNGRVQASRHRVVHDGAEARHSTAVFLDPNPHKEVAPLPELLSGGEAQAMYEPRIAGHKTVLLAAAAAMQKRRGVGYLGFNTLS